MIYITCYGTVSLLYKLFDWFDYVFVHVESVVTHSSRIHLFCHVFIGVSLLVCANQIFTMTYVYHFICLTVDYKQFSCEIHYFYLIVKVLLDYATDTTYPSCCYFLYRIKRRHQN